MFGLMVGTQWLLDLTLVALLVATLLHALRLERALGVLRRDHPAFGQLVGTLKASTGEAQAGIEALRTAADGAGQAIERQVRASLALKDDLRVLTERGEQLADRLERLARAAQDIAASAAPYPPPRAGGWGLALGDPPLAGEHGAAQPPGPPQGATAGRVRSQAERDLLAALRVAR